MDQTFINIIFGSGMAVLGWLGKTIWDAVERLRVDLNALEVSLPLNYPMKTDIEKRFDKIDQALQRIYEKLDGKQDRVGH